VRRGTVGAVALAGGLALICSACGGAGPSATGHGTHHSHSTSTTAPLAPTTSTTSGAVERCTFSQLSISLGQPGAGLGHEGAAILFTNAGTSECSLSGYPGVAALDSSGAQVQQAQRTPNGYLGGMETGSSTPPVVDLRAGAVASALVEGTDVPEGTATSCATYPALLVTPPTSSRSVKLTLSLPGCSPLQVHPVVSGTTGSTEPAQ
jgi:Protein of unknown function (DUF4232)